MPPQYRLSSAADADFKHILDWSEENWDEATADRYDAQLVAAFKHAARSKGSLLFKDRSDLGPGIISWHLANSKASSPGGMVRQPRHVLFCRWEGDRLAVGRILHDVMESELHITPGMDWE